MKQQDCLSGARATLKVLLALYEKEGESCLGKLRGMFAFGYWDSQERNLLIVRDRLGKKPLYFAAVSGGFFFAWESVHYVLSFSDQVTVRNESIDRYLTFGVVPGERTIFNEIYELLPGHSLRAVTPHDFAKRRYWNPPLPGTNCPSRADAIKQIEHLLHEAVTLRLRSDVPVGVFLSGGIDSALITALAAPKYGKPLHTFTVGVEDAQYDERSAARAIAARYSTTHHEVLVKPAIGDLVQQVARSYGEPFADPSAIPSLLVSQYASQFVKVVLNGDGGDEVFGGYRRHSAAAIIDAIEVATGSWLPRVTAKLLLSLTPTPRTHRQKRDLITRLLRTLAAPDENRLGILGNEGFILDEN